MQTISLFYYLLVSLLCLHVAHVQCKNLSKPKAVIPQAEDAYSQALQFSRQKSFQCENDSDCPPWAVCHNRSTCTCLQNMPNMVDCVDTTLQIAVMSCYCATYNNSTREFHTGLCIENCYHDKEYKGMYLPLPIDPLEMNKKMCAKHWNREGQLCGKCKPGHAPLVFSYQLNCVSCGKMEAKMNLWIFFSLHLVLRRYSFLLSCSSKSTLQNHISMATCYLAKLYQCLRLFE